MPTQRSTLSTANRGKDGDESATAPEGTVRQRQTTLTNLLASGERTLASYLQAMGSLPFVIVRSLGWQLARELDDLHRAGKVHGSVQPECVLLEPDRIRLAAVAHGTKGSMEFLAPECVVGSPPTPATDVYGFGNLLYTCLAGRPPFIGNERWLLRAIREQRPDPLSRFRAASDELIPADFQALMMRCLAKDPDARPRDAGALLAKLGELRTAEEDDVCPGGQLEGDLFSTEGIEPGPAAQPATRAAVSASDEPIPFVQKTKADAPRGFRYAIVAALLLAAAGWTIWAVAKNSNTRRSEKMEARHPNDVPAPRSSTQTASTQTASMQTASMQTALHEAPPEGDLGATMQGRTVEGPSPQSTTAPSMATPAVEQPLSPTRKRVPRRKALPYGTIDPFR